MINYFLFLVLGLLPSLIWLIFYLKEDKNPEPKAMILKIFVYGMAITVIVGCLEYGLGRLLPLANFPDWLQSFIYLFIIIALTEEAAKYLVVRFTAFKSQEFDEPVDAMIYMMVAGLGFAAVENILILFPTTPPNVFQQAIFILIARFLSATLLHALTAANIGFFAACGFFKKKKRFRYVLIGLTISVILHGIYNFGIHREDTNQQILIPAAVLICLFGIVMAQFFIARRLKQRRKT